MMKLLPLLAALCSIALAGKDNQYPEPSYPPRSVVVNPQIGAWHERREAESFTILPLKALLKRTGIFKSDNSASRALIIEPIPAALNVNKTAAGSRRPEASYPVVLSRARDIYTRYLSLDVERMRKNMAVWNGIVSPAREDDPKDAEKATFWIQEQVNKTMQESDCDTAFVQTKIFASKHNNTGPSLITRLQGRSNKTVVVGASQHRGADANGAGAMVNLEVLRVLLTKIHLQPYKFENTIEFHWYGSRLKDSASRESDGSAEIWAEYQRTNRDIWAILEQNLISYSLAAMNAGAPESFVITKNAVSAPLVGFVRSVIRTYTDIRYVVDEKECKNCTSHTSAHNTGFPAISVAGSTRKDRNAHGQDPTKTAPYINLGHAFQHAKLVTAFVCELGMAEA